MERTAGSRGRRRGGCGVAGDGEPAAQRAHAGVRGHGVPRGRGAVGAQPGAGILADALPVDGQPLPRLLARLRLLPRRAHPGVDGRRRGPTHRRARGRRCGAGHRAGRRGAPVRADPGAGALVHHEARRRRAPRGRHRAGDERRTPLPHRPRLAARQRRLVPRRAAAAPASWVGVARSRTVRDGRPAAAERRLPAGLPVRPRPGRRPRLPIGTPGARGARPRAPPAGRGAPGGRCGSCRCRAGPHPANRGRARSDRAAPARWGSGRAHPGRARSDCGTRARVGSDRAHCGRARSDRGTCAWAGGDRAGRRRRPLARAPPASTGVRASSQASSTPGAAWPRGSCGSCTPTRPSSAGSRARCTGWASASPCRPSPTGRGSSGWSGAWGRCAGCSRGSSPR